MKRAYPVLLGSLIAFLGLQALVFHTRIYAYWVNPSSSTGYLETILYHERIRAKTAPNQILGVGDSRSPLVAKHANKVAEGTGFQFGTIAVAGTTPRCWYYMLRDTDPEANRYKAILIGLDNFNDEDALEDLSNRESDLNYLLGRLRLSDIGEFSKSHHDPQRKWRAAATIAFRGLGFKRDFEDLLKSPLERYRTVRQSWRDSFGWFYDFHDDAKSLEGMSVDWEHRKVIPPPGLAPELAEGLQRRLTAPLPPTTGLQHEYMTRWMGKIAEHYRGSQTRLVFYRLPRAAWIRPDLPPSNPRSSVHELEKQANVTLLPEHLMDELEQPRFFKDEYHMTQAGLDRATEILVEKVREFTAPAH